MVMKSRIWLKKWSGLQVKVFGNAERSECYFGHPWIVPRTRAKPKVEQE